jgi:hypothetical protein
MADNIALNAGTGGDTLAALDESGVKTQRVVQQAPGAVVTSVAASATSVTLLAALAARKGALVLNDSTALLYLKFGTTASATSHTVQLPAGALYEFATPVYTGQVDGIWATATGDARVTELS